jgi:hypothetical protein
VSDRDWPREQWTGNCPLSAQSARTPTAIPGRSAGSRTCPLLVGACRPAQPGFDHPAGSDQSGRDHRTQHGSDRAVPQPGQRADIGQVAGYCRYALRITPSSSSSYVAQVAFSPAGRLLASSASQYGTMTLWDRATGRALYSLEGGGSRSRVAFSPDDGSWPPATPTGQCACGMRHEHRVQCRRPAAHTARDIWAHDPGPGPGRGLGLGTLLP